MSTTLTSTKITGSIGGSLNTQPMLSNLEIGLFAGVGGILMLGLLGFIIWCCIRFRKRKKTVKLPNAKCDVPTERVTIEPQSFTARTPSVSSTGSAAAFLMRQRSIRGRLESRLTQVRILLCLLCHHCSK